MLSSTESRDKPFALVLETMALKKMANESVFNNVREEFEDMLVGKGITAASEDYSFTIDQLQQKYKWLKKQWKAINASIRSGSGLGAKDRETPHWYDLLDPIFTESVDSFTEISSKAEDLNSVDSDNLDSDEESSVALSSISEKQSERANKAMHQEDASFKEGEEESLKPKIMKPLPKSDKKETKVKVCKRNKQPKSQSAAVMEMGKTMKEAADPQRKNNDQRLTTHLEAERKRDEMFLTFQREQAEANRKHDMLMAQMLMQMNRNPFLQICTYPHLPLHLQATLGVLVKALCNIHRTILFPVTKTCEH